LPEQRDLIDRAAHLLGKNRSDFMLEAACDKAQAVLLDQVYFNLDAERFQQFIDLLDAPPAPNPGLERLMALKAPWAKE
jgi:uncharacterized protein (DUF1778 family)